MSLGCKDSMEIARTPRLAKLGMGPEEHGRRHAPVGRDPEGGDERTSAGSAAVGTWDALATSSQQRYGAELQAWMHPTCEHGGRSGASLHALQG